VFFIFYFAKLHRRNRENEDFLKTLRYIWLTIQIIN
jgi:hypothetical protein